MTDAFAFGLSFTLGAMAAIIIALCLFLLLVLIVNIVGGK